VSQGVDLKYAYLNGFIGLICEDNKGLPECQMGWGEGQPASIKSGPGLILYRGVAQGMPKIC
jgi:hypothetical protein